MSLPSKIVITTSIPQNASQNAPYKLNKVAFGMHLTNIFSVPVFCQLHESGSSGWEDNEGHSQHWAVKQHSTQTTVRYYGGPEPFNNSFCQASKRPYYVRTQHINKQTKNRDHTMDTLSKSFISCVYCDMQTHGSHMETCPCIQA